MVQGAGWDPHQDDFLVNRIFESTDEAIALRFRHEDGRPNYAALKELPALMMPEQGYGDNMARVATLTRLTPSGLRNVRIEYSLDPNIPPISVDWIAHISKNLDMGDFEFSRTHWAIKDVDLFRAIMTSMQPQQNRPTVFEVADRSGIQNDQLSVMMPFDRKFDGTHQAIQNVGRAVGMRVNRADNIWEHHTIIQDIVSLIARSRIIVADCTEKNPNVFYEVGIAHAIGREVILITQNMDHIPFDLRHHRALTYLPNGEGLAKLEDQLAERVRSLLRA